MKKIPTLFVRDFTREAPATNEVTSGCEWVIKGEGVARKKLDGTCCMVDGLGVFWKRRMVRPRKPIHPEFKAVDKDPVTQKVFGWVPVTKKDKWHMEAFRIIHLDRGTYELIGPKVQGNPEGVMFHILVKHDHAPVFEDAPRKFEDFPGWLRGKDIEGLVFHHPDGRMAKIKKSDFGIGRLE